MDHPQPPPPPTRDVAGATRAHATLLAAIDGLTDAQTRAASKLPGWSVGHVLSHVARNADSHVRMLAGARDGLVADQYPGGAPERAAEIDAGAHRPAGDLVADVRSSAARLERAWAELPAACWANEARRLAGTIQVVELPFLRWRETLVHLTDLGLAYTPADWPADYVRLELHRLAMQWASRRPMGLTELPSAALAVDDRTRLAWLLGRVEIDGVEPAGVMA